MTAGRRESWFGSTPRDEGGPVAGGKRHMAPLELRIGARSSTRGRAFFSEGQPVTTPRVVVALGKQAPRRPG